MNRPPPQSVLRRTEAAIWGPQRGVGAAPSDRTDRPSIRLVDYRPITKGSCRVQSPSGLVIQDAAVFVGRRRAWANLPAKAWIGQDNWQKTDVHGRPAYLPVLERRNSGLADHFSKTVVALIRGARSGELADALVLPRSRRRARPPAALAP